MRTSSATNVGADKDSDKRQRVAIEGYAKSAGYTIVDWFYDKAVRGDDAVTARPGFSAMLERIAGNGVRTIIVESPDRFARDLKVQLIGHDYLRKLGVTLVPATAPDFFTEDTPTAVMVASDARRDRPIREGYDRRQAESSPRSQDRSRREVRRLARVTPSAKLADRVNANALQRARRKLRRAASNVGYW
jgi:hypothetical protein